VPDANELLRINHEVTSERDPEKRRAAIERAYVEDLRFLDSEAELVGRQAFSDRVQKRHARIEAGERARSPARTSATNSPGAS